MGNNNIYNYKTPKSGNEETGFFNIKGRINRKSFILRCLFSFGLFVIFTLGYYNGFFTEYESRSFIFFETIYFYILPLFISIFNLIQGAKRMHDVNKSGWYFFIPLYNIYLTFSPGTRGNNDYGIDPSPIKNIQYFDEIESNKHDVKEEVVDSVKKGGLDKWRDHLNIVRKENPNKTYQEILAIARNTYKSGKTTTNKPTGATKKKSNNYIFFLVIVIAAELYYSMIYEPQHRESYNVNIESEPIQVLDSNNVNDTFVKYVNNNETEKNNRSELNFNGFPYVITAIKINTNPRQGSQNVFFDKNYTLFDQSRTDLPIFPVNKNGKIVYQIYYSSNEDPVPYYGEFTPSQRESHHYYKFKNKETCQEFCRSKKNNGLAGAK